MNDLVSVIIPTYNRAYLITDAINSVLKQTHKNFELLIVDDHSTDSTEAIVKGYDDSRVSYLKNNRSKGAQGSRNTGLYASEGKWVAFLDSDDIWLATKLEAQLSVIKNKKDIVGVTCGFKKFNTNTKEIIATIIPSKNEFEFNDLLHKNFIGGFSVFLCKKSVAVKVGGVDESFPALQDRDFYTRILKYGNIYGIKKPLVKYRIDNKDSISSDSIKKFKSLSMYHDKYHNDIRNNRIGLSFIRHRLYLLNKKMNQNEDCTLKIMDLFILMIYEPKAFLRIIISLFR